MAKIFFLILVITQLTTTSFAQKWNSLSISQKTALSKKTAEQVYNQIEHKIPEERRPFIKRFGWIAIFDYNEYNVLASVKLAQGGLECNFGTILNRGLVGNNYFSIKCRGKNHKNHNCFVLNDGGTLSHFVRYNNAFDSFRGHTIHLKKYYNSLFKYNSYKSWTAVLAKRYAVDKRYANKLNSLIEQYGLTNFDIKI